MISALLDRTRVRRAAACRAAGPVRSASSGAPAATRCRRSVSSASRPTTGCILDPPGGAGYGDPRAREPEAVLRDVVDGYVSVEAAEREYGVRVRYTGPPDALVRTPDMYEIERS